MNKLNLIPRRTLMVAVMCLIPVGCGTETPQKLTNGEVYSRQAKKRERTDTAKSEDVISKVKVLSDGTILLDEERTSIPELRSALADLRQKAGAVWFYRQSANEESADEVTAVMDVISEEGLAARFSSKPNFSDSVPPFE